MHSLFNAQLKITQIFSDQVVSLQSLILETMVIQQLTV